MCQCLLDAAPCCHTGIAGFHWQVVTRFDEVSPILRAAGGLSSIGTVSSEPNLVRFDVCVLEVYFPGYNDHHDCCLLLNIRLGYGL